jgi:hypothetical protein
MTVLKSPVHLRKCGIFVLILPGHNQVCDICTMRCLFLKVCTHFVWTFCSTKCGMFVLTFPDYRSYQVVLILPGPFTHFGMLELILPDHRTQWDVLVHHLPGPCTLCPMLHLCARVAWSIEGMKLILPDYCTKNGA